MMNPYINPNYFAQPMYPQMTNYSQNVQMQGISGRLVDNIDNITANDVSMQGINVFPKNDLSEVYIKSWLPNGTIQTLRYCKNVIEPKNSEDGNYIGNDKTGGHITAVNDYRGICERLDNIEKQLEEILGRKDTRNEPTGNDKHDVTRKSNGKE